MKAFNIWVTKKCNLKCSYCYEGIEKENRELAVDKIPAVIEFIQQMGKSEEYITVNFHGGEPLLNTKVIIEDGRLQEICKKCALYEDIQKMPAGLETEIGENGEGLSVGQKHRLGMARAFLQEKPIIIIDEGTAGLDAETELVIKQYLQELCQNKITIIITHSKQLLLENAMVYELKAGHLSLKEDMND